MAYLDSEAELAGVLGHEIGHVTAKHAVRQQAGQLASNILSVLIAATTGEAALADLSQQLGTGLVRGYGRDHELEADQLGAEYLHRVGYDPENMLEVIGVLKDQEIYERALAKQENRPANIYHGVYSTHPRNDDRLQTVVLAARDLSEQDYQDDNQSAYHARIDGMVWGSSLHQGVVVNNRFAHPDLAISLELPAGWKVNNNPRYLEARDLERSALIQLGVVPREPDESADELLERLTGESDADLTEVAGWTSMQTGIRLDGSSQPARVSARVLDDEQILTLVGTAAKSDFDQVDEHIRETLASLRELDADEVAAIEPPRLRVLKREGQSFDSLAWGSALEYDAVNLLRVLNRSFPDGDIRDLDNLKTVTLDD